MVFDRRKLQTQTVPSFKANYSLELANYRIDIICLFYCILMYNALLQKRGTNGTNSIIQYGGRDYEGVLLNIGSKLRRDGVE